MEMTGSVLGVNRQGKGEAGYRTIKLDKCLIILLRVGKLAVLKLGRG